NSTSTGAAGTGTLPVNTWSFLAATFNGSSLVPTVNGRQVASKPVTGSIKTSDNPLHVGGNPIWGEYFAGLIDDVRVYSRALTSSEVQSDMASAVSPAESVAPAVSVTSPAAGSSVGGAVTVTA